MTSEVATADAGRAQPGRVRFRGAAIHPALLVLGLACLASLTVLLVMGTHLTFFLDDWEFLTLRYDPSWHAVMAPHNEHISILPVLIYEGLEHGFGMDSSMPFRVVATLAFVAGVVLLFLWMRRRVGRWLALAGALPLLFLGSAAEDLIFPFQIGYFGSFLFGLAALLALERDDSRGDWIACLLLVVATAFGSLGLPFIAGVAVCVAWDERRLSRAWIVAVPAVLYALWWIGWGHEAETHISLSSIATTPSYVLDGFGSSLASLTGLAASRSDSPITSLDWGRILLVAAIGLSVWRLVLGPRPSRWFWVVLAIALSYWFLAGSSAYFEARAPTAGRYQYVGAALILMLAAELVRGVRLRAPALIAVFAGVAVALGGNLVLLSNVYSSSAKTTQTIRSDLTALELARDAVAPTFQINASNGDTDRVGVIAAFYFEALDEFGSPAYSESELIAAPESIRESADRLLAAALGLAAKPVADPPPTGGPAPTIVSPDTATPRTRGSCLTVGGEASGGSVISLPPGGFVLIAGNADASLELRRFADTEFPIDANGVGPGGSVLVRIPVDPSSRPWQLSVGSSAPVDICGLGQTR